jgi:tetratricopeptide (TPR) repeat protein
MSLKSIFAEQIDAIQGFMADPGQSMRVMRYERDVEPLLEKVLVKLDEDENNPHILVVCQSRCDDRKQYLHDLLAELMEQNERHRDGLKRASIQLPIPNNISDRHPLEHVFQQYVSEIAECLPSWSGSYVVVIYPQEITDEPAFKITMEYLATHTQSPLAKFLVFDRQTDPILHDIAERTERIQVFEFSPDEIEKRVKEDLAGDTLAPQERRQYTAMVGAFAAAKQDYGKAENAQRQALEMARQDGARSEEAAALYNLGNTCLAQDKSQMAAQYFSLSIDAASAEELHGLVAMALTNLGVALQHCGEFEQSLESFDVARRTFKAINNPPGEAYSLDNKAQVLYRAERYEEAEHAWLDALAIYDGITAEMFSKVRETGRDDILTKLKKFYEATKRPDKTAQLGQPSAEGK